LYNYNLIPICTQCNPPPKSLPDEDNEPDQPLLTDDKKKSAEYIDMTDQDVIDMTDQDEMLDSKRDQKYYDNLSAKLQLAKTKDIFEAEDSIMVFISKNSEVVIFDGISAGTISRINGTSKVQKFSRGHKLWFRQTVQGTPIYNEIKVNDTFGLFDDYEKLHIDFIVVGFSAHSSRKACNYMVHFWSEIKKEFFRATGTNFMKHLNNENSDFNRDLSKTVKQYSIDIEMLKKYWQSNETLLLQEMPFFATTVANTRVKTLAVQKAAADTLREKTELEQNATRAAKAATKKATKRKTPPSTGPKKKVKHLPEPVVPPPLPEPVVPPPLPDPVVPPPLPDPVVNLPLPLPDPVVNQPLPLPDPVVNQPLPQHGVNQPLPQHGVNQPMPQPGVNQPLPQPGVDQQPYQPGVNQQPYQYQQPQQYQPYQQQPYQYQQQQPQQPYQYQQQQPQQYQQQPPYQQPPYQQQPYQQQQLQQPYQYQQPYQPPQQNQQNQQPQQNKCVMMTFNL
jgi:hypothetical protein